MRKVKKRRLFLYEVATLAGYTKHEILAPIKKETLLLLVTWTLPSSFRTDTCIALR